MAEGIINGRHFEHITDWQTFKFQLRAKFRGTCSSGDFLRLLNNYKMKPGQSPLDFYLQLEAAVSQSFRDYPETVGDPDELVHYHFFTGLPTWLQNRLASSERSSPSDLADTAQRTWDRHCSSTTAEQGGPAPFDQPSTRQRPPQPRPRYLGINEAKFEPTYSPYQTEYEVYATQSAVPTPSDSKWCEFHRLRTQCY